MPRIELFPFRYRDPLTGRRVKARYVVERHQIATRFGSGKSSVCQKFATLIRHELYFTPRKVVPQSGVMRMEDFAASDAPALGAPPAIDSMESFLSALFLPRYVTYCVRAGRYPQMQGAARLHKEIAATFVE